MPSLLYAPTSPASLAEVVLASPPLAGMIRKTAAGLYSYSILCMALFLKIEAAIIRDEMDLVLVPGSVLLP